MCCTDSRINHVFFQNIQVIKQNIQMISRFLRNYLCRPAADKCHFKFQHLLNNRILNLSIANCRYESSSSSFSCDSKSSTCHNKYDAWTYQHDQSIYSQRMFPTPKRWPRYNEIIHPPEQGQVERVC